MDTGLESRQLLRTTPQQALLFPGGELHRDIRSELGGCCPCRVARLGDVEPPRLPPLDGLHEGALEPEDVGHLAQLGASALRLRALHYLRLDIEGLEPQAEVGLDAEEGLAHDDKRRDVEDEVRRQIMEIQAVVEHEPPDEGMKWEAQSMEEIGKKHYPLMGPGGGEELSLVGELMRDVARQVSSVAQLLDLPLRDGGGHPLASRSGHDWRRLRRDVRTWALELECAEMDKQRRKKA